MEILHDSKFYKIEFDPKSKTTITTWSSATSTMNEQEMHDSVENMAKQVSIEKPDFHISNNSSLLYPIKVEEQDWVAKTLAVAFISAGTKKFALILPQDLLARLSTEQTVDESGDFRVAAVAISVLLSLKSLETDDHNLWHSIDLEGLRSLHMLLALAAVPLVVFV